MNSTLHYCLYHTSACHLCEEAEEIVKAIAHEMAISYQKVDIADDDAHMETYGIRIPVLRCMQTGEELGWPFDYAQAKSFMERSDD